MNYTCEQTVQAALASLAPRLSAGGNSGWQFNLFNGSSHIVRANADGDWLLLETDCDVLLSGAWSFWDAAIQNSTLNGLAKLVLRNDGTLRMAAELPVCEGVELAARLRETREGFQAHWLKGEEPPATVELPSTDQRLVDLKALCAETGWPFAERGSGKLSVELEVQHSAYQALVAPARQGLSISCEVSTLDCVDAESREAIAGLLLSLSSRIRMGRASVETSGSSPTVQFEVVFETMPGSSEISSALESLSVACSLCGEEELKALQVPEIAHSYLALRGWETQAGRRKERTETV